MLSGFVVPVLFKTSQHGTAPSTIPKILGSLTADQVSSTALIRGTMRARTRYGFVAQCEAQQACYPACRALDESRSGADHVYRSVQRNE